MRQYTFLTPVLFVVLVIIGCHAEKSKVTSISFNADSTAILISGIEDQAFFTLTQQTSDTAVLSRLISVVESPGEDDSLSMERELSGKVQLQDNKIIFKPEHPFRKGTYYRVSSPVNTRLGGASEMIGKGWDAQRRGVQATLMR